MRNKKTSKSHQPKKQAAANNTTPAQTSSTTVKKLNQSEGAEGVGDTGTPSSAKTSFVRPSLALTTLQDGTTPGEVEPYSPSDPYYVPTSSVSGFMDPYTFDPAEAAGHEAAREHVSRMWENELKKRLEEAYPRMAYYFLCEKKHFVLVTILTLQRATKANLTSQGQDKPIRKPDRQFVDAIARCMSDSEMRDNKEEEWMTWWRETLMTLQQGLKEGWIDPDSPNLYKCRQLIELFQRLWAATLHDATS